MFSVLQSGGAMMVPLLMCSLITIALTVERCLFWLRLGRKQQRIALHVLGIYPQNPVAAISQLKKHRDLPIARIFLAALTTEGASLEEFQLALETAAQAEVPLLKRFQTIFETVVGVAPLLGLLGTILGLIRALSSLQLGEAVAEEASKVTLGIGEALISTATGLVVAIIALLITNLFRGLYRRQWSFIQTTGGQLELLYRRQWRKPEDLRRI